MSVAGLRTLNGTHHGTRLTSIVLDVVKGTGMLVARAVKSLRCLSVTQPTWHAFCWASATSGSAFQVAPGTCEGAPMGHTS